LGNVGINGTKKGSHNEPLPQYPAQGAWEPRVAAFMATGVSSGGCYVQCRYGTLVLVLHGESNAVFVDKLWQVAEVFGVFDVAALAGEFDRAVLLVMRARSKQGEKRQFSVYC
jgi:hypothetical protein